MDQQHTGRESSLDLADQIIDAFRRFQKTKAKFAPRDALLRPSERLMLMTLASPLAEDGLRSSALSACHEVSPGAATQLVDALVKAGFAERADDPGDRRSVIVRITPEGRKHQLETFNEARTTMGSLVEWLGDADSKELLRLLGRLGEFTAQGRIENAG
ncbi:MAG: MarR family transcriptional regulator [Spirochaetota bacterium]